jgi:transposase
MALDPIDVDPLEEERMLEHIFLHADTMSVEKVAKHFGVTQPRAKVLWQEATSNR